MHTYLSIASTGFWLIYTVLHLWRVNYLNLVDLQESWLANLGNFWHLWVERWHNYAQNDKKAIYTHNPLYPVVIRRHETACAYVSMDDVFRHHGWRLVLSIVFFLLQVFYKNVVFREICSSSWAFTRQVISSCCCFHESQPVDHWMIAL